MGEDMYITVSNKNNLMIITVAGRLDLAGSSELENWMNETIDTPKGDMIMDFSHLDYISSAGLRAVLNLSKLMKKHSYTFSICSVQDHIREVFEISGFDTFIPLYESVDEYGSSFKKMT
jgi:anti-anti-sigma factor